MRRFPYIILFILSLFVITDICHSKNPAPLLPEEICQGRNDSLVKIAILEKSTSPLKNGSPLPLIDIGSGPIVECKKYNFCVLTMYHVAASTSDAYYAVFKSSNTSPQEIKLIKANEKQDIAILKFSDPKFKPKKVFKISSSAKLTAGTPIIAMGLSSLGDFWCSADGTLFTESAPPSPGLKEAMQQITGKKFELKKVLIFSTSIFHGYSGGPLINKNNELIGLVKGYAPTHPYMPFLLVKIGIPIDEIKEEFKIIK